MSDLFDMTPSAPDSQPVGYTDNTTDIAPERAHAAKLSAGKGRAECKAAATQAKLPRDRIRKRPIPKTAIATNPPNIRRGALGEFQRRHRYNIPTRQHVSGETRKKLRKLHEKRTMKAYNLKDFVAALFQDRSN